jgi:DNA repair photolyase
MELVEAKSIIMTNKKSSTSYLAAEYIMNIYRGCSHGCVYCFARGEFYRVPEFDRVRAKKDALRIIRDDLARKVQRGVITTGGMSDPYNPCEEEHLLTRNALELINAFSFGICILTKSALVTRDIDVLLDIKAHSPVCVNFTVTCSDDSLCKLIEPNVSTTSERFAAIKTLNDRGIITGVLMDPLLPFINDTEENVRGIVRQASEAGAKYLYANMGVTMEGIQREHFYKVIEPLFPGTAAKYAKRFGNNYMCWSPKGHKLWEACKDECEKRGLVYDMKLANQMIRSGYDLTDGQLSLF